MRSKERCHVDYLTVPTFFGCEYISLCHCEEEPRKRVPRRREKK